MGIKLTKCKAKPQNKIILLIDGFYREETQKRLPQDISKTIKQFVEIEKKLKETRHTSITTSEMFEKSPYYCYSSIYSFNPY